MKRFARDSKAGSSPSTFTTSSTNASSCQPKNAADTRISVLSAYTPVSSSISPFRDEMYVLYTVKNLCKGPLSMMYCNILPYNPSGLQPHQSMMNQCLLATAKVFYGLQNRESEALHDGLRLYGQGLSMLSNILSKANCSVTTEMIVSVFSLCMGEVCTLPLRMAIAL